MSVNKMYFELKRKYSKLEYNYFKLIVLNKYPEYKDEEDSTHSKATLFNYVIKKGDIELFSLMISGEYCNVNETDYDDISPLIVAQDPVIIKTLIDKGADINHVTSNSLGSMITPLSDAIENNNVEKVRILLEAGASIKSKYVPHFLVAFLSDNADIIELFFKHGSKLEDIADDYIKYKGSTSTDRSEYIIRKLVTLNFLKNITEKYLAHKHV
jgi:hypothetical protein